METTTSINTSPFKEHNFIILISFLLTLNHLTGILFHYKEFIISVALFVGIPGAIWTLVYIYRFIRSFRHYRNEVVTIIFFDILAIIYNFFIVILIDEWISEFDTTLYPKAFPIINIFLLFIHIVVQFQLKGKKHTHF